MIMGVQHFDRLFRQAAGIDPDKSDLKRLTEFLNAKLYDMLLMGQVSAKANGRDVIRASDLPVTKGLQEVQHRFREMDVALELQPILAQIATLPPLDVAVGTDAEERLPLLTGALTVALVETFRIIDPEVRNPQPAHWQRATAIFDLLL